MLNYVSERYSKSKMDGVNIRKGMFQEIVNEANNKFKTNEKISIKTIQSRYRRKKTLCGASWNSYSNGTIRTSTPGDCNSEKQNESATYCE